MKLAPWPRPLRLLRLKLLRLRRPPFSGDEAREICMEAAQRKKDKITTKYVSIMVDLIKLSTVVYKIV